MGAKVGSLYLLCIDEPVGSGASHYLGWALDANRRVQQHLDGRGSALIKTAIAQGVGVELVRTWEGKTRTDERALKRCGNLAQHCPRHREGWRERRNATQRARRQRDGRADRPRSNPRGPLR